MLVYRTVLKIIGHFGVSLYIAQFFKIIGHFGVSLLVYRTVLKIIGHFGVSVLVYRTVLKIIGHFGVSLLGTAHISLTSAVTLGCHCWYIAQFLKIIGHIWVSLFVYHTVP